ncbi:MAG: exodeoxyribonuclease VII large subunit, partial [Ruminococcaceae bacterium]|nr:exodeoxyribonuclease VII large subunit [Oscillospiraceae bacterium]
LFDKKHKKPIPKYPQVIGVVTAASGAAVRDIINVLGRRYPLAHVRVLPVAVQGEGAGKEVAAAIDYLNEHKLCDVIIAGRGGGSIEDLWAFNEECVARAIFRSEIPVISAVGHEVDFTIADFVADMRAPTPSAAAEIAVPNTQELMQYLMTVKSGLFANLTSIIERNRHKLSIYESNPAFRMFKNFLKDKELELDSLTTDLENSMREILKTKMDSFLMHIGKLDALSPLKVLDRGYAVVFSDNGKVIRKCVDTKRGEEISIRLSDGEIGCLVK